jgi:hypothetical protein
LQHETNTATHRTAWQFDRLQLVEDLWDEFAAETSMETRPEVLDELEPAAQAELAEEQLTSCEGRANRNAACAQA